mgnify:FL=1
MKQVRFFSLNADGFQYAGRVVFENNRIKFDGLSKSLEDTLKRGVVKWNSPIPRKVIKPKDGLRYLKLVAITYNTGSYLKALGVEEVNK